MSARSIIYGALRGLVADRVFPNIAPEGTPRPYLTYQQVGGAAVNFMGNDLPSKRNARFQLNVWADTRLAAANLAHQVEDALRLAPGLQTTVIGAPTDDYEEDTKLFGTRQDFSVWVDS